MASLFNIDEERRPVERRWLYWVEGVFLVTGILLVSYVAWTYCFSALDERWADYKLNQELRRGEATVTGFLSELVGITDPPPIEVTVTEPPVPRRIVRPPVGTTIGRIEIPRLNISAIVREGSDERTLKRAVGRVPTTAFPGEIGNVGLAAHRDTHFRNLREVQMGDLVRVVTPEGAYEYQVDSLKIVKPENVEVLNPTPKPAVTLVTCYPFNYVGSAPKRFIVRATQVNVATGSAVSQHQPKAQLKNASVVKRVRHASKRRR